MNDRLLLVCAAMLVLATLLPLSVAAALMPVLLLALAAHQWLGWRFVAALVPVGVAGLYLLSGALPAAAFAAVAAGLLLAGNTAGSTVRSRMLLFAAAVLLLGAILAVRCVLPNLPAALPLLMVLLLESVGWRSDERLMKRLGLTAHPVPRAPPPPI